jgi:hypothetical protein
VHIGNRCNLRILWLSSRQQSVCSETNSKCLMYTGMKSRWRCRAARYSPIDWIVPQQAWRHSRVVLAMGLDRKNRFVRFQNRQKNRQADCWRAKPGPVPVNPRVLPGIARPVSSNLRFCVSGFTFMVAFRYATVHRKTLPLVPYCSFSMY